MLLNSQQCDVRLCLVKIGKIAEKGNDKIVRIYFEVAHYIP